MSDVTCYTLIWFSGVILTSDYILIMLASVQRNRVSYGTESINWCISRVQLSGTYQKP